MRVFVRACVHVCVRVCMCVRTCECLRVRARDTLREVTQRVHMSFHNYDNNSDARSVVALQATVGGCVLLYLSEVIHTVHNRLNTFI